MIYIFNKHYRPSRPILGPWFRKAHKTRIPDESPLDFLESYYGLKLRQVHSAYLIAIQTNTGLYKIIKNRAAPAPTRPVRRKTLEKYVAMNLAAL